MDFEKLGAFYLGKGFDLAKNQLTDELVMYDARDLTTHAVCVGMTGSGKTGRRRWMASPPSLSTPKGT